MRVQPNKVRMLFAYMHVEGRTYRSHRHGQRTDRPAKVEARTPAPLSILLKKLNNEFRLEEIARRLGNNVMHELSEAGSWKLTI